VAKKAKHSDAIMTGIFVTRFKMGQIDVKDLEQMAADTSRAEKCSEAKKVIFWIQPVLSAWTTPMVLVALLDGHLVGMKATELGN